MMNPPRKDSEENTKENDDLSKLNSDDFNDIYDVIKLQGRCETNILFTAFKVSSSLRNNASQERPDAEEMKSKANLVEEFATTLIDPLKSNDSQREDFGDSLDSIIDKAIKYEQKKFISHPVVYNLLDKRWIGQFYSWRSYFWKRTLLWLWCLLEIILFPFVLIILFVRETLALRIRIYQGCSICFILHTAGNNEAEEEKGFDLMKKCILGLVRQLGVRSVKYCVISEKYGEAFQPVTFQRHFDQKSSLVDNISALERETEHRGLLRDVIEAREVFKGQTARKKILFLFTNHTSAAQVHGVGRETKRLRQENGLETVPIAIGENAYVENLREIASMPNRVISCGLNEDPLKLGCKLLRAGFGDSYLDLYREYFVTPYFIFARDTLSYVLLLCLHVAICLSPSVVTFTMVEWSILVFFLGRFVVEVDQCYKSAPKEMSASMDQQGTKPAHQRSKSIASRILYSYLSDRWNVLDMINLIIYFVIFILRMITWGTGTSVPGNRQLVIAQYLYGLNAAILTLRVFGSLLEANKGTGVTHIALVRIIEDVAVIFVQFAVGILACSLAMTKVLLAELSFTADDEEVLQSEGMCSGAGFSCFWKIVQHLVWTLLGIADVGPFTSHDSLSNYIAQALYAVFIILALILLVNMMIAILSSTYERVESNSLIEWSFKRAIIIRTFSNYHPIPVPWNLISQLGMFLIQCIKSCRCRYGSRSNYSQIPDSGKTSGEDQAVVEKDKNFNRILDELKDAYLATHGASFPLTDPESKITSLLTEARRNREMCNQIAQKVLLNPSYMTKLAPVGPAAWITDHGLQIEGCLFTHVGQDQKYSFQEARYRLPFSKKFPKLAILLQEDGRKQKVVVGVVRKKGHDSILYYTSDGSLRDASGDHVTESARTVQENVTTYRGDLIVCLVDFENIDTQSRVPIRFTLNGTLIHEAKMKYVEREKELYPLIRMFHKGTCVLAKVCSRKNDADDFADAVEQKFQTLQERVADICEIIVFSNQSSTAGFVTTGPKAWHTTGIQIDGFFLTYVGGDICKTCKFEPKDFHGARYKQPFSENFPKLEVLIMDNTKKRELVVGVVRAKQNLHAAAGESDDTVGYHASDGRIRDSCEKRLTGAVQITEGKVAFQGDSIICAVEYGKLANGKVPVVFTLNGEMIYQASMRYEKGKKELYPFVGMGQTGIRVLAKVCSGGNDEKTSGNVPAKEEDSIAELKVEFQNLNQRIEKVVEEKKKTDDIKEEQEKKIDHISNSLNEILQILRDMNVKTSSD